jgi:hypothetical protein
MLISPAFVNLLYQDPAMFVYQTVNRSESRQRMFLVERLAFLNTFNLALLCDVDFGCI